MEVSFLDGPSGPFASRRSSLAIMAMISVGRLEKVGEGAGGRLVGAVMAAVVARSLMGRLSSLSSIILVVNLAKVGKLLGSN